MSTVILSLPKSIVFVALGAPSSENSKGAKVGKVIAIGVLVVVTIFASRWIRQKMAVATREIEAERAAGMGDNGIGYGAGYGGGVGDEESHMLRGSNGMVGGGDTSYKGVATNDSEGSGSHGGAYQGYAAPNQNQEYGMAR